MKNKRRPPEKPAASTGENHSGGNQEFKYFFYPLFIILPFIVLYWMVPGFSKLTIGHDYGIFALDSQLEANYSLHHNSFPLYAPGFACGQSSAALTLGEMAHPLSHLARMCPGYWQGHALDWNTFWRLLSLGIVQLIIFILLQRLGLTKIQSFIVSFITVYNMRMLDMLRYGAALECYTGFLLLCASIIFYFIKPTKVSGPLFIIFSVYCTITGGHPVMYLCILGAAAIALLTPFLLKSINKEYAYSCTLTKFYCVVFSCCAVGFILSSVYALPFYFEFVSNNVARIGRDYRWSLAYSDTWGGTLNSFFSPLRADVHGAFGSSSIIGVMLFFPALFFIQKKFSPAFIALWIAGLLVFLCSMGAATPIHHLCWEYIPLFQDFRTPGRINILLPPVCMFFFLWLFKNISDTQPGAQNKSTYFPPGFYLGLCCVAAFLLYNLYFIRNIPPPGHYNPKQINNHPEWIYTATFWTGLASLIFFALFFIRKIPKFIANAIGLILIILVIAQVMLELRWGTWIVRNTPSPTLAELDRLKSETIMFQGSAGTGMYQASVARQMSESMLEQKPARFYRKFEIAGSNADAYAIIALRRTADMAVVEDFQEKPAGTAQTSDEDSIDLKYSAFNKLIFNIEAKAPGFFVLAYPYEKLWKVFEKGNELKTYRANGYETAVFLEKGDHELVLQRWSVAYLVGMGLSIFTLAGIGIFCSFQFKKKTFRIWGSSAAVACGILLYVAWYHGLYTGDNLGTHYQWRTRDFPRADNAAYAKKTWMSSIKSDQEPYRYYSGLAVDGDRKGRGFLTSLSGARPWWQVDLGEAKNIRGIDIYDNLNLKRHVPVLILLSKDGADFSVAATIETRHEDMPLTIVLNSITTRFIRIQSSQAGPMSISEVEVY